MLSQEGFDVLGGTSLVGLLLNIWEHRGEIHQALSRGNGEELNTETQSDRKAKQNHAPQQATTIPKTQVGQPCILPIQADRAGDTGLLMCGTVPTSIHRPYPADSWQLQATPVPAVTSHSAPWAAR